MEGANFNINTMLEEAGELIYVPVGNGNPALDHGMTVNELIELGGSLDPAVEEAVISYDQLNNSRSGLKTMGAFVKNE